MTNSAPSGPWTPQQLAGITTVGHSLLVSAAAGSGKTAVLAERCAHLICQANNPCDVDQLLVVTFTESAAAEMKTRIQQSLRRKMAEHPSDRIARQIDLAEHAHVSTVHGFCARLLRQNFTLAGIDPEFQILDADEAALLRRDIATELFHSRYETDESGDFPRFIDAYGDGKDEALVEQVVVTHQLLASLTDPDGWIEKSDSDIREAAEKPLAQSTLGRDLLGQIETALASLLRRCDDAKRSLRTLGRDFFPYVQHLEELSPFFVHLQDVSRREGLDMLISEVADFRAAKPRAPAIRGQPAKKDLAKSLVDSVKNALDEHPLADLLSSTGDQWREGMKLVAPHARAFLSLVRDFAKDYSAAKDADRALDFADLERRTLDILRDGDARRPSALARSLHEQFRHVLVDEYQDINPIQDAILGLVSRECVSDNDANLFCVGDVKQSIFRFRLAEPGRFLRRHERFFATADKRRGEVIHLRENFRSRAPLLEAINGVFERLMTRQAAEIEYDESHRLAAGLTFPPPGASASFAGAPIELHFIPKDPGDAEEVAGAEPLQELERVDYEAILLARRIRQLMGQDGSPRMHVVKPNAAGEPKPVPIDYGDMVILLRAMQHKADRFADVLRAHDIPVHSEGGTGFFEATEVRDMICLLQILDNQQQDIPLATVLRSPLGGLPNPDDAMAQIRLAYLLDPSPIPFHEAVSRYAAEQRDELAAHLNDFLNRLTRWRDQANKRPVAELLWRLYEETGYLAFCGGLEDAQQRVANLLHLHERAGQFGSFLRQSLYRFLRFLENLQEQKDISRPSPVGQAEQVVRIMSIHRSKGLEFPVVLLPDLGKQHNLTDTRGPILVDRRLGLGMSVVDQERLIRYPSLASTLVEQSILRQTMSEELRLLYVAMTRAKEHLILVATCAQTDRQGWISQWTGHVGPLPSDVVQGARRAIDWLGPVAAMTANAPSPIFEIHERPAADVRAWKNPRHQRREFSDRQQRLARLEPLPTDPPVSQSARQLIDRFQTGYAYDFFSRLPAAASVTSLAKGAADEPRDSGPSLQRKLDLPRFFLEEQVPKATDVGNATHTVLQYFDFGADAQLDDIERQIANLVDRKLLLAAQAKLVDRQAIHWLLQSDVGKLIRANHANLIRELPFALAYEPPDGPPTADALDQIMIRGRIDLLVPGSPGLSIIDYKTDNVSGPEMDERVEIYSRQMRLYAQAIRKVAHERIAAIHLVFLRPRQIVTLGAD
ncbi:MAG: helicase-exonuclease AddAB subunit AddA [Tepidisphaeraceae bacterium]